jgi:serine/threonine-protein kinase
MKGREERLPARLGRYEVVAPLGKGGMASVYLGRSAGPAGFSKHVALKVLHANYAADQELIEQFIEEAKIAALIRHPNVVSVHEVGEDEGVFLVMDYVDGGSLAALIRAARTAERRLPLAVILRIICDALAGLHAAHELHDESGKPLGVIHRDFSPQNILVGKNGVTQLADFGVAKILTAPGRTRSGVIKGKVRYMAPEQVRGEDLGRRCDVWAAGVILWELLSGQRLYGKKDDVAILVDIATKPVPSLRKVAPNLPADVEALVMDALNRDRGQRIGDAETLRRRIQATCEGFCGIADPADVAREVRTLIPKVDVALTTTSEPSYSPQGAAIPPAPSSEAAHTDTISLETLPKLSVRRRGSWLLPALLGLVGAGTVGVIAAGNFSAPEPEVESVAVPVSAAPSASASSAAPADEQAADASAKQSVTTVDAAVAASAKPEAGPKPTRPVVRPRPKPKPKPAKPEVANPDTLPPSPY